MTKIYLDIDNLLDITDYWKEMNQSFSSDIPTSDNNHTNLFNVIKEAGFECDSLNKYDKDVKNLEECLDNYYKTVFNYINEMNDSNNYIKSYIPKYNTNNDNKNILLSMSNDYVGNETKIETVDANKLKISNGQAAISTINSSYSNAIKTNMYKINNNNETDEVKLNFINKINAKLLNNVNNGKSVQFVTYVGNSSIVKKYMTNINRGTSGHFVTYKGNINITRRKLENINKY